MAPPPHSGSLPGPSSRAAAGASGNLSGGHRPDWQAESGGQPPRRHGHGRPQPSWLIWLPMGLSSLLLVLFAVVVNRQQAQAERLGELLGRVQALEQSRALERTAVLEQQLRSMLTRLQQLEKAQQQQELGRQLQSLRQELQQLRSSVNRLSSSPAEPGPLPEELPRLPRPTSAPPASPAP